jgi:hypothetical protein
MVGMGRESKRKLQPNNDKKLVTKSNLSLEKVCRSNNSRKSVFSIKVHCPSYISFP